MYPIFVENPVEVQGLLSLLLLLLAAEETSCARGTIVFTDPESHSKFPIHFMLL